MLLGQQARCLGWGTAVELVGRRAVVRIARPAEPFRPRTFQNPGKTQGKTQGTTPDFDTLGETGGNRGQHPILTRWREPW